MEHDSSEGKGAHGVGGKAHSETGATPEDTGARAEEHEHKQESYDPLRGGGEERRGATISPHIHKSMH